MNETKQDNEKVKKSVTTLVDHQRPLLGKDFWFESNGEEACFKDEEKSEIQRL